MNILIISFDKNLVNGLKHVLRDYNVLDAKNGEEAIHSVSSFVDVVIYDAVSGSISEEDINNVYRQKFKDAKYIILVDDLFPVDMRNLDPPRKVMLSRDQAQDKILQALRGEVEESSITVEEPFSIPVNSGTGESIKEEVKFDEPFASEFGELQLEKFFQDLTPQAPEAGVENLESSQPLQSASLPADQTFSHKKLLIVSFDTELVKRIKDALSSRLEIMEARNIREVNLKAAESDIIIFDTISGMLAYRTLMEMSKDESLREKPYLLLIDELFAIDADSIPLPQKFTFAREVELAKAINKVEELLKEQTQQLEDAAPPLATADENVETEESLKEDEKRETIMNLLEQVIGSSIPLEESSLEEEPESEPKAMPIERKEEYLSESISEVVIPEAEQSAPEAETPAEDLVSAANLVSQMAEAVSDLIKSQLSQEKLQSILLEAIQPERLVKELSFSLEIAVENYIKEKIDQLISKVDIAQIIREEAYRVLKERLRELVT